MGFMKKKEANVMRRTSFLLAATAVAALVLSPGLAYARAGNSSSMGSRGSMTQSAPPATRTAPTTAQPMQRTMTPSAPVGGPSAPGMAAPSRGFLGFLLQIGLIALAVMLVVRLFRGSRQPQPAMAGGPNLMARDQMPDQGRGMMGGGGGGGGGRPGMRQIEITPADYQQFEQLLQGVQAAWSNHDLNGLRAMSTPEMLSYFGEQLSDQASRGVRNSVTDVRLLSGDLAEAWAEGDREYATVAMKFSMVDVTRDTSGRVVDGNPAQQTSATEVWTFLRARGGHWILSAIQQAG